MAISGSVFTAAERAQIRSLEYVTIDVFTDELFGGNQLAVFPEAKGVSGDEMQAITREFNFSESIFLEKRDDGSFDARIFTPGQELDFAGHPTVGAALILRSIEGNNGTEFGELVLHETAGKVDVTFSEQEGVLRARFLVPFIPQFGPPPSVSLSRVAEIVGLTSEDVNTELPFATMGSGLRFTFLPVRSSESVAKAKIDVSRWEETLASTHAPQLYLFHVEGDRAHARMFAPGAGIVEDPATGAAAAAFGSYMGSIRGAGTHHWIISQGAELGRPSSIAVTAEVSQKVDAVFVEGSGVIASEGVFYLR